MGGGFEKQFSKKLPGPDSMLARKAVFLFRAASERPHSVEHVLLYLHDSGTKKLPPPPPPGEFEVEFEVIGVEVPAELAVDFFDMSTK